MEFKPQILRISHLVTKYSIYALVFLIPVFAVPFSPDALDFNKQALLVFLVFISLFAWMVNVLISGNIPININKVNIAMGMLFLVSLASTIFSVSRYGSFWGWPQIGSESLLSVICFLIVYFLAANTFLEKEIFTSFLVLGISSLIALVYGVLQIIGLHVIPFGFANNNAFNTVGSIASLGFFAVVLLPLWIVISIMGQRWWKALFIANVIAIFALLVLIDYDFLWWIALAASSLVVLFWILRRDIFDGRWMALPIFFIVIALFFIIFNPQMNWLPSKPLEVSLSQRANLELDTKVMKSFPLLGSGPGTFAYDFAKFRDKNFNQGILWNVKFQLGASKMLTYFATLGIIGFLAYVLAMIAPLFYGVSYMVFEKSQKGMYVLVSVLGILSVLLSQTLGYFLANTNISLDFLYFFLVGCLMALISKNKKIYALKPSSLLTLIITVVFTSVFIFGVGLLILEGQRYVSSVYYSNSLVAWQNGNKSDAVQYLKRAANASSNVDLYFNQLSLFSLASLQDMLANTTTSTVEDKQQVTTLASDAIGAANVAINVNPNNVENWSGKGYVCQSLIGLVASAADCSIQSYDKAIELNPTNPYLLLQEGYVYVAQALNLQSDQSQNKDGLLSKAKDMFTKAVDLKPDYSLAYLQVALVSKLQHNTGDESQALLNAEKYSPNDAGMAFQIGVMYYQDKNLDKAEVEFQRALSLFPQYADALYFLGLTYDQQGQKNDAINAFSKILEANPQNQAIQKILDNLRAGRSALDNLVSPPPPVTPLPINPPVPSSSSTSLPKLKSK